MIDYSIIIPIFNSESCLQNTIDRVSGVLGKQNKTYEIILIDDGSTDNSWNIIKSAINKNIKGIRLSRNYGQHNALLCGLNNCNGEFIITIDDDLEHRPEDIAALVDKLTGGNFDLVYGVPISIKKNIFRMALTFIYKNMLRTENKRATEGSSFRVFTKNLKENLIKHSGSLFFLDEIVRWYTDKLEYVKVDFERSKKVSSGYGYHSLLTLSLKVLSLSSTLPLRLVRALGFSICGVSFISGVFFIIRKFMFRVPMGYTSLMVVLLFSTGVITFALGIIGEYIGNLIALSNNKPSYSIKERYDS